MTINSTHSPADIEQESPEHHSFHVSEINASGTVNVGDRLVHLYTHSEQSVSLDRFEEILVDLLAWTRQRQNETGLENVDPLFPRP